MSGVVLMDEALREHQVFSMTQPSCLFIYVTFGLSVSNSIFIDQESLHKNSQILTADCIFGSHG